MLKQLPSIVGGAVIGLIVRFLFRQFMVINADYFLGPVVKVIWSHVFHPDKSIVACPICTDKFYNLPN